MTVKCYLQFFTLIMLVSARPPETNSGVDVLNVQRQWKCSGYVHVSTNHWSLSDHKLCIPHMYIESHYCPFPGPINAYTYERIYNHISECPLAGYYKYVIRNMCVPCYYPCRDHKNMLTHSRPFHITVHFQGIINMSYQKPAYAITVRGGQVA